MTTTTLATHRRPEALSDELLRDTAAKIEVCVRPLIRRVTDTTTGESETVPIACGSTRASVCPSCAAKARRLRMQQCREGWHRTDDPADLADDDDEPDAEPEPDDSEPSDEGEAASGVRRRSTKRLAKVIDGDGNVIKEFPSLPLAPDVERRTVGRELTSPTGVTYRPSTFLTLTLPSYGPVRKDGTPRDPATYDYRRAALDAIHFPKLLDRFWQNLRRCAGYKVQYFGCVEPQRRLALHAHAAVRGAIPRQLLHAVADATYEQVWWPKHDEPVYPGARLPLWDERTETYVDPDTLTTLVSWEQAMDATYEPDAEPAHLSWFGEQVDAQWFIPDSSRTDKRIGYICKYLTKNIAEAYDPDTMSTRQRRHLNRLHREIRWVPCCPDCPNWLRYGVQPKDPEPGMQPGYCPRPAHQLENIGHGGRRVLVSRDWSGKTLAEHKADRAQVVRAALAEAGIDAPETDRWSADRTCGDGTPRYVWQPVADVDSETYRVIQRRQITERLEWRAEYDAAKAQTANDPPDDSRSATQPEPAPAAAQPEGRITRWAPT